MLTRRDWAKQTAALLAVTVSGSFAEAATTEQTTTCTMYIKNLHCEGCATRLRASIFKVAGVKKVQTNVEKGIAIITPTSGGSLAPKAIWEAAEKQEFQVSKLVTPAGTYENKPQS